MALITNIDTSKTVYAIKTSSFETNGTKIAEKLGNGVLNGDFSIFQADKLLSKTLEESIKSGDTLKSDYLATLKAFFEPIENTSRDVEESKKEEYIKKSIDINKDGKFNADDVKMIDTDKDGIINKKEMAAFLQKNMDESNAKQHSQDINRVELSLNANSAFDPQGNLVKGTYVVK